MDDLIRDLPRLARVLDLGAGGGSFVYPSTAAGVTAVDVAFPVGRQPCMGRIIARSEALPLKDASIDVVVCNHTFEHFEKIVETLFEINRVIKRGGFLWVSIPNGFSFDDDLYRFVFSGGGHVNRFSFDSLLRLVECNTQFHAVRFKQLYTGFVYLNPPSPEKLGDYPRTARLLARIPPRFLKFLLRWGNYLARTADDLTGSRFSHYGWGFVFRWEPEPAPRYGKKAARPEPMPADLNVCFSCGAGHPVPTLVPLLQRFVLWKFYRCPVCGTENVFYS
ncbi:MAG TPA: class I SAM-dependent methyltransferase [Acidobacteriota bacterium]|jgi:SAM-dependent methyltransferase